jgi:hypothetical protein
VTIVAGIIKHEFFGVKTYDELPDIILSNKNNETFIGECIKVCD